jgi:phosphoserine phosphatase
MPSEEEFIRLMLVRAGATAWDEDGRLCGACDLPMSETGRADVAAAMAGLNGEVITTILCGPDESSVETARALRAVKGGRVKVLEGLREIDFGLWEGLRLCELEEKCPKAYRQWCENPAAIQAPEGETLEEAEARILGTLGRALEKRGERGIAAVVLRPAAFTLVSSLAAGVPPQRLVDSGREGPAIRTVTLPRSMLGAGDRAKAGARH